MLSANVEAIRTLGDTAAERAERPDIRRRREEAVKVKKEEEEEEESMEVDDDEEDKGKGKEDEEEVCAGETVCVDLGCLLLLCRVRMLSAFVLSRDPFRFCMLSHAALRG